MFEFSALRSIKTETPPDKATHVSIKLFSLYHPSLTLTVFIDDYTFNKKVVECDNFVVLYKSMNSNCKTVHGIKKDNVNQRKTNEVSCKWIKPFLKFWSSFRLNVSVTEVVAYLSETNIYKTLQKQQ